MKFTDIFVQRPVLSLVLSMLILVLGMRAIFQLPVSQYPETENAVVTISTTYYGADAATVAGLHYAAARGGDLAGAGYRLPVLQQQHGRVGHPGDPAPELRFQPRAD